VQLAMGNVHFEASRYGRESAATYYTLSSALSPAGALIGTGPRFTDSASLAADVPGAEYDHESFLRATRAVPPAVRMPQASRTAPDSAALATPGPPAYLVKHDGAHYKYPAASGFSIAANLRTDWSKTLPGNDSPGPGAHGGHTALPKPTARASLFCKQPAASEFVWSVLRGLLQHTPETTAVRCPTRDSSCKPAKALQNDLECMQDAVRVQATSGTPRWAAPSPWRSPASPRNPGPASTSNRVTCTPPRRRGPRFRSAVATASRRKRTHRAGSGGCRARTRPRSRSGALPHLSHRCCCCVSPDEALAVCQAHPSCLLAALLAQAPRCVAQAGLASAAMNKIAESACRFFSHSQSEAGAGAESPGVGRVNLSNQVGHGRSAQLLKQYTGKMARSMRAREAKVFVSRAHAAGCAGGDSPGPAQYSPKETLWDGATSKFKSAGGCAFGTATRPGLAKIAF
jgi:hypothetical protein